MRIRGTNLLMYLWPPFKTLSAHLLSSPAAQGSLPDAGNTELINPGISQ